MAELTHDDLHSLAAKAQVIVNMVGPYALYGEPVIEACVSNETHYLDVCVSLHALPPKVDGATVRLMRTQ